MLDFLNIANLKLTLHPRGSKYAGVSYNIGTLYVEGSNVDLESVLKAAEDSAKVFQKYSFQRSMQLHRRARKPISRQPMRVH
jgi:hypothetical protein